MIKSGTLTDQRPQKHLLMEPNALFTDRQRERERNRQKGLLSTQLEKKTDPQVVPGRDEPAIFVWCNQGTKLTFCHTCQWWMEIENLDANGKLITHK